MKFNYSLIGAGWAKAILITENSEVEMIVSYLHDTLKELATSTIDLYKGIAQERVVIFMDEPGEHHWIIEAQPEKQLEITVRWYKDWASWNMHPLDQFDEVLNFRCSLKIFAEVIFENLESLYNDFGLDGYRDKWGEHDFPYQEYLILKELLKK